MADPKKEYKLHGIEFRGEKKHIVLQNAAAWTALVEIANFLLLADDVPEGIKFKKESNGDKFIEKLMLDRLIITQLLMRTKEHVENGSLTKEGRHLIMQSLHSISSPRCTSSGLCPIFKSIKDFERCDETLLYEVLGAQVYHGWLVSPKDTDTSKEVSNKTHSQLLKDVKDLKASDSKESVHKMSLIQNFLNKSKTQLTAHGLACLSEGITEDCLSILFRDAQICVLYKHGGVLHTLVTTEGVFEKHPNVVWKKLENVDQDGDLVTSTFVPIDVNWSENERILIEDEEEAKKQKQRKTFGPIDVNWSENERILIEDEEKAKKQKQMKQLKNAKRHERAKVKRKTVTQDESGEAHKVLVDKMESYTPEDKVPTSQQDGVLEMLKDRFMHFLKEFPHDGELYFRGQVHSMLSMASFDLLLCYDWIKEYDKELAKSICNNYYRAAEDLRQCFCDYFHSIIQEKAVAIDQDELYKKIKLTIGCLPSKKRTMSFEEFAAENCMYTVYGTDADFLISTSYIGRAMALGYLQFILQTHKSGLSWNGTFEKSHMSVKIEKGKMRFKIKIIAAMVGFNKEEGIADFTKYKDILFPLFKKIDVERYPAYFDQFIVDFMAMPDPVNDPVKFMKFQKYMGSHLFAKAPLARFALATNTFRVCDSFSVQSPVTGSHSRPAYPPLDVHDEDLPEWSLYKMSEALRRVFTCKQKKSTQTSNSEVETFVTNFEAHTYWCALMLERHAVEHLLLYTKKETVQTIQDLVIVDLVIGRDLNGLLAKIVWFIMKINNFDGPFSSVWRTFIASETFDEPAKDAAVNEDKETKTGATAAAPGPATGALSGSGPTTDPAVQPSRAPLKLKCKMQGEMIELLCDDLRSLKDGEYLFDSVIDFVYARISLLFAKCKDILLVRPALAFLIGNIETKAELEVQVESLDLKSRRMVFVPINDNTNYMSRDGGNHWSLLVIHIAEDHSSCRFVHHDSMGTLNHSVAVRYADVLREVLPKAPKVINAATPMQLNGVDCGICVLSLTEAICKWWMRLGRFGNGNCWEEEIKSKITGQHYVTMRVNLRQNLTQEMQTLALGTAAAAALDFATAAALDFATAAAPALATATISSSGPSTTPAVGPPVSVPDKLECKVQGKVLELSFKDLSCLEDKRCMADHVMDFIYACISCTFDSQEDLLLMRPMHAKTDLEVEAKAKSLDLGSCRMVLVPIDGNVNSMHADGGRHWSLLVIHIEDCTCCRFVHYDSLYGTNRNAAIKYANFFKQRQAPQVIEGYAPRQLNESDSSICVLALTKAICAWWIKRGQSGESSWEDEVKSKVTGSTFAAMRVQLRQNLMEEMETLATKQLNLFPEIRN